MLSTCPNCLNQIMHSDAQTEVKCSECGTTFAAFLKVEENTGEHMDGPMESSPEPAAPVEPMGGFSLDPINLSPEPSPTPFVEPNFEESAAAFNEIRDFGENMNQGFGGAPAAPTPAAPMGSAPIPGEAQPVPAPVLNHAGEWLMTSGDLLQNYRIDQYLSPVSVLSELVPGDNPMGPAFQALKQQAGKMGANAVVAMRWSLSGDASKVLVSGTAVRASKQG